MAPPSSKAVESFFANQQKRALQIEMQTTAWAISEKKCRMVYGEGNRLSNVREAMRVL